jgi:class 3 adenylate cyclase
MEREVRYCKTSDGVRIAYTVEGEGPAVILLPRWLQFTDLLNVSEYAALIDDLGRGRTLVHYDGRGTGLSERGVPAAGVLDRALDIEAVVGALGLADYSLYATGFYGPLALAIASTDRQRVTHLVLENTYANFEVLGRPDGAEAFSQLARTNWPLAAKVITDTLVGEEFTTPRAALLAALREASSGELVAQMFEGEVAYDARASFSEIQAPALVLHSKQATTVTFEAGRELATGLQNARLIALDGPVSYLGFGETQPMLRAIDGFLPKTENRERRDPAPSDGGAFRVVLFTDLVGHTEMMSRLGDERGRAVLREHEEITRGVLKQYGGTEVKTMGDGFMASFGSVTRAVECAIALQRAFAERKGEPLAVRVGLNAGEPIEEDGDLFGATVILASRIAAEAEGGEILVADTVRGLCSGKGFLFAERGEFVAKGFEEPVRVYEVRWG